MNFTFFDDLDENDKKQLLLNIERSIIDDHVLIDENYQHGKTMKITPIIINKLKENNPLLSKLLFLKNNYNNLDNMLTYNNLKIYYTILTLLHYDNVSTETIKFLKDKEYDNEYLVNILENNKHIPHLYEFLIYYRKIALLEMRFNMKNKKFIQNRFLNRKYDRLVKENRLTGYTDEDKQSKFYCSPSNQIYYDKIYTRYKPTTHHLNFCQPKINDVWKKANIRFIGSDSTYQTEWIKEENENLIKKVNKTREELKEKTEDKILEIKGIINVLKEEKKSENEEQKVEMEKQKKEIEEQKFAMEKQKQGIEEQKLLAEEQKLEI
jgi:hypothetical protein